MRIYPPRVFTCVFLLAVTSIMPRCTPAPKFHGRGTTRVTNNKHRVTPTVQAPRLEISFSPPIKNFRRSRITSYFGLRQDPRYKTEEFHYGLDIKAHTGEEIFAAAPGTVSFAGRQRGFGKLVVIDHGNRICTVYAHLSRLTVEEGQAVERGKLIGRIGKTGNATGTHLHFEIRKAGKALNPLDYL
jgi:murein DD-endopeptidase MepM/ murein hydrolase activator NlpD